jgi:methionyl-tRNA formyltransferase
MQSAAKQKSYLRSYFDYSILPLILNYYRLLIYLTMKIVFAGTPLFAKVQLEALIKAGFNIVAVYTQPDRPVGRGLKLQPSEVKKAALAANIPVEQPVNFKSTEALERLQNYQPDLMIVSAYGLLLPKTVLNIPKRGCWNVHGSLLPRWRGAAPIQYALLSGDSQTGITLMQMDEGLDTGAMLLKQTLTILPTDTSTSLYDKLAHIGADLLVTLLKQDSPLSPIAQDNSQATLAPKITKTQAKLDWNQSATQLFNAIRAFNPWPVAHTSIQGINLKVWQAEIISENGDSTPGTIIEQSSLGLDVATGQGVLRLTEIQLPDKRKMTVSEVINGRAELFAPGQNFE